ncbi:MAG: hypothetical protein PHC88_14515 [Terrimicrobiaceae bacterium]|nr:hypothetical protein [Terrimicrobiaceae bacterium]
MDTFVGLPREVPRITDMKPMNGPVKRFRPRQIPKDAVGTKHVIDCTRRVVGRGKIGKHRRDGFCSFLNPRRDGSRSVRFLAMESVRVRHPKEVYINP